MRKIAKTLAMAVMILGLTQTPSFASSGDDVALTFEFSKTPSSIKSGDNVDVIFTIENVGQNSIGPRTVNYIIFPPELTYTGSDSSIPNFTCNTSGPMSAHPGSINFNSKYDSHIFIGCLDPSTDFLADLAPGEKLTFTIHSTAIQGFVNGSTSLVALNLGNPDETDYDTFVSALQVAAASEGDPALIQSNNIASYEYSAPAPATTTTTATSTTTSSTPVSQTTTVLGSNTTTDNSATATNSGETLPTLSGDQSSVTDKAQVAIGKKLNLPDKITQPDKNRPRVGLSEKYKDEVLSIALVLLVVAIISYLIRRRYLRSISKQRDYRDALKVVDY